MGNILAAFRSNAKLSYTEIISDIVSILGDQSPGDFDCVDYHLEAIMLALFELMQLMKMTNVVTSVVDDHKTEVLTQFVMEFMMILFKSVQEGLSMEMVYLNCLRFLRSSANNTDHLIGTHEVGNRMVWSVYSTEMKNYNDSK